MRIWGATYQELGASDVLLNVYHTVFPSERCLYFSVSVCPYSSLRVLKVGCGIATSDSHRIYIAVHACLRPGRPPDESDPVTHV